MATLKTKDGRLTAYAFGCGYTERRGPFKLFREHGAYHVRGFGVSGHVARSYRTLTEGRRGLRTIARLEGTSNRHDPAYVSDADAR